jgi:tetratricopeptide (TPR) repeat protein
MYRIAVYAAAVLLAFAGVAPAAAEDSDTCFKSTGDEAIAACTRQIKRNPKDATAYYNRGVEYDEKKDYDRAIADYDQAIRINPDYAYAYNNRGKAYNEKGDYDRAITDFNQAIRIDPKLALSYNNRGNAYKDKGDHDRAIADYNQAIQIDPKYANAYNGRGAAYWMKGDYDHAIAEYDQAIRLNPKDANPYAGRGGAYEKKGDYDRALADFDLSLQLNPNGAFARAGRERVRAALAARPNPARAGASQAQSTPAPAPSFQLPAVTAERRVALVVGNSRYRAVDYLPNPKRDADAVAAALRGAGFQSVTVAGDLGRDALRDALRTFRTEADAADWALIYYAGHGIQINGTNYLIPVDAKLRDERDVKGETVGYDELEETVRGAQALRIIILDACRNDPFAANMARHNPDHAISRGLRPPPEGRPGLLVVYSARDGQVAEDGDGEHSPFATALIAHVKAPGREVRRMFDDVSDDVLEATRNRQQPFTYGRLPGKRDFFFVTGR